MYTRFITLIILTTSLFVTGCASPPLIDDNQEVAGGPPLGAKNNKDSVTIMDKRVPLLINQPEKVSSSGGDTSETLIPSDPLSVKVILFDFDSSTIRASFEPILRAHGRYLTDHPQTQVTIEGHADERGTREYNLALGEQRALSVKQFLMDNGVADGQLQPLSYGEERPVDPKENEAAWSKNRRVELAY